MWLKKKKCFFGSKFSFETCSSSKHIDWLILLWLEWHLMMRYYHLKAQVMSVWERKLWCGREPALILLMFPPDEFRGYALLQAARDADLFRLKKQLSLETINFKHPQTHETPLVRRSRNGFIFALLQFGTETGSFKNSWTITPIKSVWTSHSKLNPHLVIVITSTLLGRLFTTVDHPAKLQSIPSWLKDRTVSP